MWEAFVLSFIPLFIVIDAVGNLPFVLSMSEGLPTRQQRRLVNVAVITATIVGLAFLFFGRAVLNAMKIQVGEFAFAGGIIVLALSINHMLTGHFTAVTSKEEMVAVVPIGTPLVVGPATITTLLFLTDVQKYALYLVLLAFASNLAITWIVFRLGFQFARFLGQGGLRAVSRVFNLILAAIGVSMMFQGLALLNIITLPG